MEMAAQSIREWTGINQFPAATQTKLLELLAKLKQEKVDTLTIIIMGKGGVGKSSTVNSIVGERVVSGRFLLAAVSGRVLVRSFHSALKVGQEMIEKTLGSGAMQSPDSQPEMTWRRMESSAMLEHVQAHVAPTDVDPGAGLQWLPKIRRNSPKVMRTGALLERVFMPCDMYFRFTRHKGGTTELKMKPLKELIFNSQNITATMTSRQFQVMMDVLTNLLFARPPKYD